MKKKSILFVDLPQLTKNTVRYDFNELFCNLRKDTDEIRTYAEIPREQSDGRVDIWRLLRVATTSGAFPVLCPFDPDPLIVEEIRRTIERSDIGEISLLSGDNGFTEVLRTCQKKGIRTKVILPPNNGSYLLRQVADDVRYIDDYSSELTKKEEPRELFTDEHNEPLLCAARGE